MFLSLLYFLEQTASQQFPFGKYVLWHFLASTQIIFNHLKIRMLCESTPYQISVKRRYAKYNCRSKQIYILLTPSGWGHSGSNITVAPSVRDEKKLWAKEKAKKNSFEVEYTLSPGPILSTSPK